MIGTIRCFDETKLYGMIGTKNDRKIFFHVYSVRPDFLGRQRPCATNVGSQVEFDLIPPARPGGRPAAIDVHPLESAFDEPVDLETHRELSTIVHWNSEQQIGWASREFGDWLAVSNRNVITEGLETVKIGSRIYHGIQLCKGFDPLKPITKQIVARDIVRAQPIEICLPDSEAPPAAISTPPRQSILLTDRLRGVKLRNIRFRKPA